MLIRQSRQWGRSERSTFGLARLALALCALGVTACREGVGPAGFDGGGGIDGSIDGGIDGGIDGSIDGGIDGGIDSGIDGGDAGISGVGADGGTCPAGVTAEAPNSDHTHVPVGTPISYPSNPPAGGAHWPVWARWGIHQDTVPLEYLVHNEEHGGVILFYNLARCPDGCPGLVAALSSFVNAQPQDSLCTAEGSGVHTRMVLSADPGLDVIWAAASWGSIYKSTNACVLTAPLQAFKDAHYAKAQEDECAQGGYE